VDDPTAQPGLPVHPPSEPRQRWRVVYSRERLEGLSQRDAMGLWEAAAATSGLPVAMLPGDPARPRMAFAAPLPAIASGERELVDLFLTDRRPVWEVRERLIRVVPERHRLVELYDVWLGEPSLAGLVTAAIWRAELEGTPNAADIELAVRRLTEARSLVRERRKGDRSIEYDLRPLLGRIEALSTASRPVIGFETMFHVERGVGRPDEVVGALGDAIGTRLEIRTLVRQRLRLATDR
jgi:radical SAM-linked protein